MAYGVLVSLTRTLEQILNEYDQIHFPFDLDQSHFPEKQKIESLREKFTYLQTFLQDSSERGIKTFGALEKRIGKVAYRAEDIIERLISMKAGDRSLENIFYKLRNAISLAFHGQPAIIHSLHVIMDKVDSIQAEALTIINNNSTTQGLVPDSSSFNTDLSRSATTGKHIMVGFDKDALQIKDLLTSHQSRLQIIPIVGMGGIGKTTLARNVYEDPLIVQHFHVCAWVKISQDYRVPEILLEILQSTAPGMKELHKIKDEDLEEKVYQSLKGRRYVVVLDDVWNTNVWDEMRRIFPDDNMRSRIMLTTRLSDLAFYVNPSSDFHQNMHFLDEIESWNLLCQKSFAQGSCPAKLERIGKEIAKNCNGLGLTIVIIGGLLSKHRTEHFWNHVAENVSSFATTTDQQCIKTLTLSYNHLPPHLKACFLYLGIFPEDHKIRMSKLIWLWNAHGILKPRDSTRLEKMAKKYAEDLANRNLIVIHEKKYNGEIKTFYVHDLLRDFCIRKGREERFLSHIMKRYRSDSRKLPGQRYVIQDHQSYAEKNWVPLKVFDSFSFEEFPHKILDFVHLRHLAFAYYFKGVRVLPASISRLRNLQTLVVKIQWGSVLYLPFEIWQISQLCYLNISADIKFQELEGFILPDPSLARIMKKVSVLEKLHTLLQVIDFEFTMEAVKMIPNLKKLGVLFTQKSSHDYHYLSNLVHLHQLEDLKLVMKDVSFNVLPCLNFTFPLTLKKLTLVSTKILWNDVEVIASLPNLEVLKLEVHAFHRGTWEPTKGGFIRLKFLKVYWMYLDEWIAESNHFPVLEHLVIRVCPYLKEIPPGIGEIPTLQRIEIDSQSLPALASGVRLVEEQRDLGNDGLKLHVQIIRYGFPQPDPDMLASIHSVASRVQFTDY